jgi:asparagine synthase (glutamine-hydrolysing)
MHSPDGRYCIVFNGEIYNYIELRQLLSSKGVKFHTSSDTEVLLQMYINFGEEALAYLNGMFAFAVHDMETREIFLARDHFGIKPLYYYCAENFLVFGSEIKALLAFPGVPRALCHDSLEEYVHFQFVLGDRTLFKDILKLEPGHYLRVRDGKVTTKQSYWHLSFDVDEGASEDQYANELLVLLESSVSMQVRSDVEVGAHLSGGLDSSIISTLASKSYYGRLKTFTGGFTDSPKYNETPYARIVSSAIGSDHHEVFPTPRDFLDHFEKLVYHMDEPGAGPGLFPQYMVSRLASQYVKVVLGGQGGDEVFGGYARYAVAYLEQCIKGAIFETQEEGKHIVTLPSIIPHLPLLKDYVPMIRRQFSDGLFDSMDRRYFSLINRTTPQCPVYSESLVGSSAQGRLFDKFSALFNEPRTTSYFNKMTSFDIKTLLPALLQVEDRVSMAVSLESRVPMLDKRIVEMASRMPPLMKFSGGKTKYMLQRAVMNILPKQIVQRKDKMGFPTPFNEWMTGPLRSYVADIFHDRRTKERGIFNMPGIDSVFLSGNAFTRDLWGVLNLEIWMRKMID